MKEKWNLFVNLCPDTLSGFGFSRETTAIFRPNRKYGFVSSDVTYSFPGFYHYIYILFMYTLLFSQSFGCQNLYLDTILRLFSDVTNVKLWAHEFFLLSVI